jgi:hypothetical protein
MMREIHPHMTDESLKWFFVVMTVDSGAGLIGFFFDPDEPYRATLFPGVTAAGYAQAGLQLILLALAGGVHVTSKGRLRP